MFVRPPAALRWSARLGYERVTELLVAIRQAEACAVPDVALRYVPDQRTGEAVLACGTGSVLLDAEEVSALHNTLRAHMPDRMRPLPV
ncbi:hypothetical protein SAMN05216188_11166 [Lentzea xinjiangensis]|uniref:Uncharacterized protein n=1 Tax=Lentzea xinjiangensis TaxID=402600 RepID=A0A1H9NYP6_9PSEU|nr:hypothetical protein [Lentzea xinjiangensis]SER41070.1 hypothetical protein SAMN05216188_11166 [Lentzea xinjiangensis]